MTKKGDRIVAKQILYLMNKKQKSLRFVETLKALCVEGWFHTGKSISENYKYLIEQGKVAHIENQYCLVQKRVNGTKFCIINDPVERTVEL